MTQIISRLYDSHANAAAAVDELHEIGFGDSSIAVVSPMPDATHEQITATIMKGYVWKPHAAIYAEHVKRGGTLVTVLAPFGRGVEARMALCAHDPVEPVIPESLEAGPTWEEAAPMSSAFHLPLLMDNPAPLSSFWNLPVLTRGRASLSAALGLPEVSDSRGPYRPVVPFPLLSEKAAPLSSMLGLPLLTRSQDGR